MTRAERSRILRECAVDLIRASDLSDEIALQRITATMRDLERIRGQLRAVARRPSAPKRVVA